MKRVLVFGSILALLMSGCGGPASTYLPAAAPTAKTLHRIVYEVEGNNGAYTASTITYEHAGGDSAQFADVELPWKRTLAMRNGNFMYVSAQNGSSRGSITCRIYVDDTKVKETISSGAYVIATCSGTVR